MSAAYTSKLTCSLYCQVVTADHFTEYVKFHNKKLFLPEFEPKPCCYTIRRAAESSPEGVLSIETKPNAGAIWQPVTTMVQHNQCGHPFNVALSASTTIQLQGEHFVHGFLMHQFSSEAQPPSYKLTARARQFSSFILLAGRITGRCRCSELLD